MSSSLNILLFGETGVGKSSVINLIAGREVAKTSPDVQGCTMSFKPYTFPVGGRTFHIWDMVGLEEPEMGVNGYLPAIEQAYELIQQLTNRSGVDLLLFCIRGNRVTATTQSNYRLFYEVLCRSKVPITLVVTHLEREANMEDWWERHAQSLENYGIKIAGHACVTGLPTHSKYRESRENITKLLAGHNGDGRFNMPAESWFIEFLHLFGLFAPLKKEMKRKDILKVLTKRCELDPKLAEELATNLGGRDISRQPWVSLGGVIPWRKDGVTPQPQRGVAQHVKQGAIPQLRKPQESMNPQPEGVVVQQKEGVARQLKQDVVPQPEEGVITQQKEGAAPQLRQAENGEDGSIYEETNEGPSEQDNQISDATSGERYYSTARVRRVDTGVKATPRVVPNGGRDVSKKSVGPGGVASPPSKVAPTIGKEGSNTGNSGERSGDEPPTVKLANLEERKLGLPSLVISFGL